MKSSYILTYVFFLLFDLVISFKNFFRFGNFYKARQVQLDFFKFKNQLELSSSRIVNTIEVKHQKECPCCNKCPFCSSAHISQAQETRKNE